MNPLEAAPVGAASPVGNIGTEVAPEGFDLLRVRPIRALVRWGGFPYVFQAVLLVFFVTFAFLAWGVFAPPGVNAKLFAKTHLVTLVIWGVWWPVMVWVAVLLGRIWCMLCPLELVSNGCERLGRRLGIPQRSLPRWFVAGTMIVVLYAAIHLLVFGGHIDRVPAYTAWFLLGLIGLAAVTGLVIKDRAYCRGFCPVGLVLGIYGRGGMLAVRAKNASTCQDCLDKECLSVGNRDRLDARSCPSLLNPSTLGSNKDCVLCGQCIKACASDNMRLLLRRPFATTDARAVTASWPVTLFVMLDSGFVVSELVEGKPLAQKVFLAAPAWAAAKLGWLAAIDWITGAWALFILPFLAWGALAGVMRLGGARETLGGLWRRMALPAAVVVAAAHMAAALTESVSWSRYLPAALRDPGGVETVKALMARTRTVPVALLGSTTVGVVGLGLVIAALFVARREQRLARAQAAPPPRSRLPVALAAVVFLGIMANWP